MSHDDDMHVLPDTINSKPNLMKPSYSPRPLTVQSSLDIIIIIIIIILVSHLIVGVYACMTITHDE